MLKRKIFGYQIDTLLTALILLGGLITSYAMVLSRLTGLETTIAGLKQSDTDAKEAIIRLSDKIDHNQETLIFYLKDDENKDTHTLRPRNLVTFMQPPSQTRTVN